VFHSGTQLTQTQSRYFLNSNGKITCGSFCFLLILNLMMKGVAVQPSQTSKQQAAKPNTKKRSKELNRPEKIPKSVTFMLNLLL